MADLVALNLREADLAYLSACQTATGDLGLLDEALHLAGALQLVGYRHVLATPWSISDATAPDMADIAYAHLLHPDPDHPAPADQPEADRAPYALHHAVTRLRRAHPGEAPVVGTLHPPRPLRHHQPQRPRPRIATRSG